MTTVSQRVSNKFRKEMADKMNKVPFKYYDTRNVGDILSRMTNDVDTIGQTLNQSFSSLVTSTTLFIGSIIMMFITNWIMAITAILSSIIGFVFMFVIISKSQKYFKTYQQQLGALNGDRKSTRLNSSHVKISYAVFCLKKKKKII